MMNRVEKCMVAARRVWGFIWKECTGFRAPYYSWHPQMPCVHIITTLNWGFFLPIFFAHFHRLFSGRGGDCVIKRRPVVVRGPEWWWVTCYQRPHCLGGHCSSTATCGGLVVCDRSVCDPSCLFYSRRGWYADLLNPITHSSTWLVLFWVPMYF